MKSWHTVETLKTQRQLGIWQVQGKWYILSKMIKLWGEIEWPFVKVSVTSDSSCKPICSFNALEKKKQPFVSYSKCLFLISSKKKKRSWRHRIRISTCDIWKYETMTITRKTKIKTALFLCPFLDYCITIYVLIWRKDCETFQIIFHIAYGLIMEVSRKQSIRKQYSELINVAESIHNEFHI